MPKRGHIRHGSLQFYPRKRADKILPRVKWDSVKKRNDVNLLGFIGYKVGMKSAYIKDNTNNSMTKGKRIIIPVTIIECPPMRILSIRFYKNGKIRKEILNNKIETEMKKKIKLPKDNNKSEDLSKVQENDFDDLRVIVYSQVRKTGIKKTPDISEIGLSGSVKEKIEFVKNNFSKEISIKDFANEEFIKQGLIDIRGVTKGKGFQGSTKRFGLNLLPHKTEKGVRGPGTGGAWHPARVEFRQPMAGQMGFFTRILYNSKVVYLGNISEKRLEENFENFGNVKSDYLIVDGSVQGPEKRQLLLTYPLRPTKKQIKKNYEFLEMR